MVEIEIIRWMCVGLFMISTSYLVIELNKRVKILEEK